jgi:hypothetical protein
MDNNSMVQPSVEQQQYDRRMAQQSPDQYRAMIKGLGELARSKLMSEPDSSSSVTPASLPSNEPPQPA